MKFFKVLTISLLICSCSGMEIEGDWRVKSDFHKAEYRIESGDEGLNAVVLFYDDGTTRYESSDEDKRFYFKGLKSSHGRYVDGMTGATNTESGSTQKISIDQVHHDTLLVTTLISSHPLIEKWTRIYK